MLKQTTRSRFAFLNVEFEHLDCSLWGEEGEGERNSGDAGTEAVLKIT